MIYRVELLGSGVDLTRGMKREYTTNYQVIAHEDAAPDLVATAVDSEGNRIPKYGEYYIYKNNPDIWAACYAISATSDFVKIKHGDNNAYKWVVTVKHSTDREDAQPNKRDNPLNDPPVIGGTFQPFNKAIYFDADGNLAANTAGFPITPPIQRTHQNDTLTIRKNTVSISLPQRTTFMNRVNSVPIWGLLARQVKLTAWRYTINRIGDLLDYVTHDYEFVISYEEHPKQNVAIGPTGAIGFYETRPNRGFEYYDGGLPGPAAPPAQKRLRRSTSTDKSLTGAGVKLTANGDRADETAAETWLVLKPELEADFRTLPGIPFPVLPGPFV